MRCVGSQDVDVALIRLLEPRDNPQEGRFAAAARTEKEAVSEPVGIASETPSSAT